MYLLNKLFRTSETGLTLILALMLVAGVSLIVIPVAFSGIAVVLAMMTVVMLSVLVIPVLYINSHQ